jgi:hypothetical protein
VQASLEYGLQYALDVRPNDARGHAGTMMYYMVNRSLGETLAEQDWTREHPDNLASMVHPSGSHAVSVAAGNRHTGNPDKEPTTKRDRGLATQRAVATNAQMEMFSDEEVPRQIRSLPAPWLKTWMLVHYIDHVNEVIRAEISLPLEMTEDNHVKSWISRIILEPIPFMSTTVSLSDDSHADDLDQSAYEAPVTWKAT